MSKDRAEILMAAHIKLADEDLMQAHRDHEPPDKWLK
jgi:hypothetical protein